MKRSVITVVVSLVLASLVHAQDAMQKKADSLGTTLGAAVGKERRASGGGRVREFEKGAIFWTRKTGARFVGSGALEKYKEVGGESGALGYPVGDETMSSDGLTQFFEHGLITTSRTGDITATILEGVTLTESALTVTSASPVILSLDDNGGFLNVREQTGVDVTISCSCDPAPSESSQRLGFCTVSLSQDRKRAVCRNKDCSGDCFFESVAK